MLIQVIESDRNTNKIRLYADRYPRALVVIPGNIQRWCLLDSYDERTRSTSTSPSSTTIVPAGRTRKLYRGSKHFQLQPLQRTTTTWEMMSGYQWNGLRWAKLEVSSDPQNPRLVFVTLTPIYDCDRVSQFEFEIRDFDFKTRIHLEEDPSQAISNNVNQKEVVRVSRYQRTPVI